MSQVLFAPSPTPAALTVTPVVDLIGRLAIEFRDLADLAQSVQDLPGRLGRSGLDDAAVEAAQRLDEVTQRLDALATFALALADAVPAHWKVDAGPATALLTLSDLQRRLAGLDHQAGCQHAADDASDEGFEMF